jgi:hypothetical protein
MATSAIFVPFISFNVAVRNIPAIYEVDMTNNAGLDVTREIT